jgi:hypothetical protein
METGWFYGTQNFRIIADRQDGDSVGGGKWAKQLKPGKAPGSRGLPEYALH